MPYRSKNDPADRKKGGRSPVGKIFIIGAVELSEEGQPRRIRLGAFSPGRRLDARYREGSPSCIPQRKIATSSAQHSTRCSETGINGISLRATIEQDLEACFQR